MAEFQHIPHRSTLPILFMTAFDHNAGVPEADMWSVGIQRNSLASQPGHVSYVGNRGAWWNSNGALTDPNGLRRRFSKGNNLSLASEADQQLLLRPLMSLTPGPNGTRINLTIPV